MSSELPFGPGRKIPGAWVLEVFPKVAQGGRAVGRLLVRGPEKQDLLYKTRLG